METSARDGLIFADNVYGYTPGQLVSITYVDGRINRIHELAPLETGALAQVAGGTVLDLRGKLVLPGLIDAHLHAIATGMLMLGVDCHEVRSIDELRVKVAEAAQGGDEFVRLGGLDPSRLGAKVDEITHALLDDWLPGRPLAIKSVEGHSSWFNTAAWERIGVDDVLVKVQASDSAAAEMRASGRVTGAAYEKLTTPIYDSYSHDERRKAMRLVIDRAQSLGLAGMHCLEGYGDYRRRDFELMLELDASADIDLTLYCREEEPHHGRELGVKRFGGCWLVDGAMAAWSAAISEPYADKPESRGTLYHSDAELTGWIEAALQLDMQPCVHAIGDRAIAQVVGIFEQLAGRYDLKRLRPRVDHWVLGTQELAERASAIGVIGAMQPVFDAMWGGTESGYATRLGPQRALNTNPVGGMISAGLSVAGSSDSYIGSLDPLAGMRAAMYHHNPEHRVSFDTAVEMYTARAAYFSHDETARGAILPGYDANFTVVDGTRELTEDARVVRTVYRGRTVHEAEAG